MAGGGDWSAGENAVVAAAYVGMLESELRKEPYVKALVNAQVRDQTGRSKGSVEYKFQNVSTALRELRHPFIRGYQPASNFQVTLVEAVTTALAGRPSVAEAAFEAMTRPAPPNVPPGLGWNVVAAPAIEVGEHFSAHRARRAVKRDYVRLDAENRTLGLAGEVAVVRRERALLTRVGRPDLAREVEHVSQTEGDGLGFDVLSFEPDGTEKFIEVKTTRQGPHWPMLVSRNEVSFSEEEAPRFHVFRLFDFAAPRPGLYTLRGSIAHTCGLTATTFEARPRQL